MKSALLLILASASVANAATVALESGQWIQLNFSNAATTAADLAGGFNSFQTNNNATNAVTGGNTLINSQGDTISGVTMGTISGWNGLNGGGAWNYTGSTLAGNANWASAQTTTFIWANGASNTKIVLNGLSSALTYNVYIYSKLSGGTVDNYNITINGVTEAMTGTRGGRLAVNTPDLTFSNVTVGGDGKLDMTWTVASGWNPFVNAIAIQVVPEPSTYAFAGLGAALALGLVVLRRRKG